MRAESHSPAQSSGRCPSTAGLAEEKPHTTPPRETDPLKEQLHSQCLQILHAASAQDLVLCSGTFV